MAQPSINVGTNQSGSTLNGLFRQKYSKQVKNAIPDFAILQKRLPFSQAEIVGDYFNMPVVLSDEHGFTYGGSTGAAYTLNSAVAMQLQNAQVQGSELTLTSAISYGAVSRSMQKGQQSVERAVDLLQERMKASMAKRVEIALLYGQSPTGIGQIASGTGSGGTRTYTISVATHAYGIWAGLENCQLDVLQTGSFSTGPLNTNAPVVITAVNVGSNTVTVSGNSTDLSAIDAAISTGANFFFYGAAGQLTSSNVSKEMAGIDYILLNTGSLFNINSSTYNLWASQTYPCSSAELSMGKVLSALAIAIGRGLMGDVQLLVAPDTWGNLNSDLGGQRMFDESYDSKTGEKGVSSIKYHSNNGGVIEVISHPMVKRGEAFLVPFDLITRVGSTDVAFRGEGPSGEEDYFFQNTSTNSWTIRAYTDQAVFIELPAHCVKLTNIVAS
jgi:hypothetical protein